MKLSTHGAATAKADCCKLGSPEQRPLVARWTYPFDMTIHLLPTNADPPANREPTRPGGNPDADRLAGTNLAGTKPDRIL